MNKKEALFGKLFLSDIEEISRLIGEDLAGLKSKRILFFGGTGFIGTWLTTSLLYLNNVRELDIRIDIVTRSKTMAKNRFRELDRCNKLNLIEIDLKKYQSNKFGEYDIFINGATSSTLRSGGNDLYSVGSSSYFASKLIEDSARRFLNLPTVVNLSSGSVYEKSRSINSALSEQNILSLKGETAYDNAKLITEQYLKNLESENLIEVLNLRLFAFYGPLLELNEHFAIGNFMRDAMLGRGIVIRGSKFTKRSYLYPTDLMIAIIKFINNKTSGNFNLGGENPLTMAEVAGFISKTWQSQQIIYAPEDQVHPNYYWPNVLKTKLELGSLESVTFLEGLRRWKLWLSKVHIVSE